MSMSETLGTEAIERIFRRDVTLWTKPEMENDLDWLGWLDLPDALSNRRGLPSSVDLEALAEINHVIVLGMGGSSLTALVLADLFDTHNTNGKTKRLSVIDTSNPRTVRDFLEANDLSRSHFFVSSKSGTTIEPLSLDAVVRHELAHFVDDVPSRFTAITDADTPLAQRAASQEFRAHVATPENVGGRFSALSAFGMYPAGLCNMPVELMAAHASQMFAQCQEVSEDNPGYALGRFLAQNAATGRDKLTIITSDSLKTFGTWLEQLIAESTGKSGVGLVPVVGEPELGTTEYGDDRQFVRISLASDESHRLHPEFQPSYDIQLKDVAEIGAEFLRWEFAVAIASVGLGVYPFDQPNVESAKQYARQALDEDSAPDLETISLTDVFDHVVNSASDRRYVALCAFLPESEELTTAFANLRGSISRRTLMATTFGYGPRYLHSTGQLHKGGCDSVTQVVLIQEDSEWDVPVPGANYTLAQLNRAQAVGDVMAMRALGRDSMLVLLNDPAAEIEAAAALGNNDR